jgi:hypothetical protein
MENPFIRTDEKVYARWDRQECLSYHLFISVIYLTLECKGKLSQLLGMAQFEFSEQISTEPSAVAPDAKNNIKSVACVDSNIRVSALGFVNACANAKVTHKPSFSGALASKLAKNWLVLTGEERCFIEDLFRLLQW